jgi:hypothetical protein
VAKGGITHSWRIQAAVCQAGSLAPIIRPNNGKTRSRQRGWTTDQITEAIQNGQQVPAVNLVNPGNTATRFIHPITGRSVVVDDVTEEVIHVGGDGFVY